MLLVVLFLLWQGVVPTGSISYSSDFKSKDDFIGELEPDSRVEDDSRVIGNPVYFNLRTPRNFDTAKIRISYKDHNLSLLEAGMMVDTRGWGYQTKPLENRLLDKLGRDWEMDEKDGLMLWQRSPEYDSLEEFLSDRPDPQVLALYNYDLGQDFLLPDYSPDPETRTRNLGFRGSYEFYTYIKDEDLNFEFELQDMDEKDESSEFQLNLYFQDKIIDSRHLSFKESDKGVDVETLSIEVGELPEGLYKLEVRTDEDVVTRSIKTSQQKVSFSGRIYLHTDFDPDQVLYMTGREFNAKANDPAYLQTINFDSGELEVNETYKRFSVRPDCNPCALDFEKGGLILATDGVFALTEQELLDPSTRRVEPGFDPEQEGISYILAEYSPPKDKGDHYVAEAEFDLSRAQLEKGEYKFMISAPELRAEQESGEYLEIKEVEILLEGQSLWEKIKSFFN